MTQKLKNDDTVTPTLSRADKKIRTVPTASVRGTLILGILLATSFSIRAQNSETSVTTSTQSVATPVAPLPVNTTQSVTTTTTSIKTRTLFLRSSYQGDIKSGSQVYVRPNGRIYDQDAVYVGHLTDLDDNDLSSIPDDHRYKIRNLDGAVIASTKMSMSFDDDRKITLALADSDGHQITESTETTSTTSSVSPPVPATPEQSSTTTTTTGPVPEKQTSP